MEQLFTGMAQDVSRVPEERLPSLRVVFLGDGDAGKSHIIDRILANGAQLEPCSAPGIPGFSIRKMNYCINGCKIRVDFWDFGGQAIMHSFYRLFLTQRTLYVVVLNARDGRVDEQARYWLHTIRSFANNAPVLMVLNKIDTNPYACVNERDLRVLYPNLKHVIRLSALSDSLEAFHRSFLDPLMQLIRAFTYPYDIPGSWARLEKALGMENSPYIRATRLRELCGKYGIADDRDARRDLLEWFNDLGICFCYRGSNTLEDRVLLRPEWLLNAIYTIVYRSHPETSSGLLPHDSIRHLLRTAGYEADDCEYILHVMRKFRMSFLIQDDTEFLPPLCGLNPSPVLPEYENDPETLEFRICYEYLPIVVIHRLMVERHRELDPEHIWRRGARFSAGLSGLSAVVSAETNQLRIFVRCKDRRNSAHFYLDFLRGDIERISNQLGLVIEENQIIYKADGVREAFDYDDLLDALECGELWIRSKSLRALVNIKEILNPVSSSASDMQQLIRDILASCAQMQQRSILRTALEYERSEYLRNELALRGYIVEDQTLMGISSSAKYSSEPDLMIYRRRGMPTAVCEMMDICNGAKPALRQWETHLQMLLSRFHRDLDMRFLIGFVDCPADRFRSVCESFLSRLRDRDGIYAPVHCTDIMKEPDLTEISRLIAAMRCTYDLNGFPIEVCHIFVHMGR